VATITPDRSAKPNAPLFAAIISLAIHVPLGPLKLRRTLPEEHGCAHPGCAEWGAYGYAPPGFAGLEAPTVWYCAQHKQSGFDFSKFPMQERNELRRQRRRPGPARSDQSALALMEKSMKFYSVTTIVSEWRGNKDVKFDWFLWDAPNEPRPYAELIENYGATEIDHRLAEGCVDELFTAEQAAELKQYLNRKFDAASTTIKEGPSRSRSPMTSCHGERSQSVATPTSWC